MNRNSYILKSSCTDTVGIVAAVTGFLAARGSLITDMSHFVDDSMKPKELERLGQDVESSGLNRAIRWHAEHRVFESGVRTVVLRH